MPLNLPSSRATVRLQCIDTTAQLLCHSECLVDPVLPGHEYLNLPNVAWLIENRATGQKILFDNGVRKDFWNLAPVAAHAIKASTPGLKVEKDVATVLQEAGQNLEKLDWIVWSHHHWDHIGNVSLYPKNVGIVVGGGFGNAHLPGHPTKQDSPLLEADLEGRPFKEIEFENDFRIGAFRAHDFFGDGSFYLLDTPGHTIGHISGLARTSETDFVFLGGDICHFVGTFRPSTGFPLPDPLPSTARLDRIFSSPCSASTFLCIHPHADDGKDKPFYRPSHSANSFYLDPPLATKTIGELAEFDASPDVFVTITHDPALMEVLPLMNDNPKAEIGDWKKKGYKEACHWGFLNELPRDGKPGRGKIVDRVYGEFKD